MELDALPATETHVFSLPQRLQGRFHLLHLFALRRMLFQGPGASENPRFGAEIDGKSAENVPKMAKNRPSEALARLFEKLPHAPKLLVQAPLQLLEVASKLSRPYIGARRRRFVDFHGVF